MIAMLQEDHVKFIGTEGLFMALQVTQSGRAQYEAMAQGRHGML